MTDFTIYHNPRCSKSRATLALLDQHGVRPKIVDYLATPPSAAELEDLLGKLGIAAEQLVRKSEATFTREYAGKQLGPAEWIEAMVRHPILIERPIVVAGDRAVLGRPPENVRALL